jgi:glycine cleavage system H protein
MNAESLRYTRDHEWVKVDGDRGTVGITDYAQKQLGDVVFLELPEVGKTLAAGERFGTVESVKAVSELFSPLAGEVLEVNSELAQHPDVINTDPQGKAWMIVIKLSDPAAASALMDAKQYEAHVAGESK